MSELTEKQTIKDRLWDKWQGRVLACYPIMEGITAGTNLTKIYITARRFDHLWANPGQGRFEIISYDSPYEEPITFVFIAPNEMQESITHTYETPDSLIQNARNTFSKKGMEGWDWAVHRKNPLIHTRVDIPIQYKDSEHRRMDFTFSLSNHFDSNIEITKIIYLLKIFSCPAAAATFEGATIKPPCVFTIKIKPFNNPSMIYFHHAALINISTTWKGPYSNGHPIACDLQLSFQEYEPLFDFNFTEEDMNCISVTSQVGGKGTGDAEKMSTEELYLRNKAQQEGVSYEAAKMSYEKGITIKQAQNRVEQGGWIKF